MDFQFKQLEIKNIQAQNFVLSPLELKDYIDFDVKRIYLITHPTGDTGQHSHLNERELFVLVQGQATAVIDRGNGKEDIQLTVPKNAIYVGNYIWHGFKNLSPDAIILALSSTNYNPKREDYIEDYGAYQQKIKELKVA